MSLDKAITYGKEKRKPYQKSKRFDSSCRNHGSCGFCYDSRTYQHRKEQARITDLEKDTYDLPKM